MKTLFIHIFIQIFMSFKEMQLKRQMLYTDNFLYAYNLFKWRSSSFRLHQIFPIVMIQMFFPQTQQAPGPDFNKVGKSLSKIELH